MKALPHTALALALLTGGLLLGRGIFSPARKASPPDSGVEGKHDPGTLSARLREWTPARTELQREMERVGSEELKALGSSPRPDPRSDYTLEASVAHAIVVRAVAEELCRRGGMAAMEWAASLADSFTRNIATTTILDILIQQDPEAAEPWLKRLYPTYGTNSSQHETWFRLGLKAAAARGTDELIRVHGMFPSTYPETPLQVGEYSADFDFAKLHAVLGGKMDLTEAISRWAVHDADAAWRAVKAELGAGKMIAGKHFSAVLLGAVLEDGEEAATKWAAERLAELPAEQRAQCLRNLDPESRLSAEGFSFLLTHLPAEDRIAVAEGLVSSRQSIPKTCVVLETLPRETVIRILTHHLQPLPPDLPTTEPKIPDYPERAAKELQTRLSLTAEERVRVEEKGGP